MANRGKGKPFAKGNKAAVGRGDWAHPQRLRAAALAAVTQKDVDNALAHLLLMGTERGVTGDPRALMGWLDRIGLKPLEMVLEVGGETFMHDMIQMVYGPDATIESTNGRGNGSAKP